jgi:branched-chain amino acid transport system substrate-binding protein
MRVGGKAVEGAYVVSGPAVIAEQLPDSHPSKKVSRSSSWAKYEKAYGAGSRNQFAGHGYDFQIWSWKKPIPMALKTSKPGTQGVPRWPCAKRLETMGRTVVAHGVHELDLQGRPLTASPSETGVMTEGRQRRLESRVTP